MIFIYFDDFEDHIALIEGVLVNLQPQACPSTLPSPGDAALARSSWEWRLTDKASAQPSLR